MTYLNPARRAFRIPLSAIQLAAVLVAAAVLAAIIVAGTLGSFIGTDTSDREERVGAALMDSGRQWELERRQQSGYGDPLTDSGRQWELERRQQGGFLE